MTVNSNYGGVSVRETSVPKCVYGCLCENGNTDMGGNAGEGDAAH